MYLNIWTPAIKKDEKLPVMLWIFGGGFRQGYSNKMELDGEALANQGVVYVSINYRLGPYGFLAHPELSAESGGKGSGNYGLLDQVAALKWVRRNIEAFWRRPGLHYDFWSVRRCNERADAHLIATDQGRY